ncbi:MAG: zinc ABC transporter substrate-binding protein [Candidatus Babeliales bacterium]
MNKYQLSFITITTFLFIFFLCIAYSRGKKSSLLIAPHKKIIVCTTTIIADAVHAIVGDKAHVITLMGPDIDPHLYKAKEQDIRTLTTADVLIYNGLHLEGKMAEIMVAMNRYTPTFAVTETLSPSVLIKCSDTSDLYDPHIWLNVHLWIQCVDHIFTQLCRLHPTHKYYYTHNYLLYKKKLEDTHAIITSLIDQIPDHHRYLITSHNSFSYFAAYGLTAVGVQGINTEIEVGTRDLQLLAAFIVEKKIPAIFPESSVPPKALYALQEACAAQGHSVIIGPLLFTDSLGGPNSVANTYENMMLYNTKAIVQALS